ncbi:hypothetical protein GQ53DRAFT_262735 [Thozetella sp. PMI_491]|nr:hypothetical protein GQ53DRAFT_262735 [Thozetella sp. PMI_491]
MMIRCPEEWGWGHITSNTAHRPGLPAFVCDRSCAQSTGRVLRTAEENPPPSPLPPSSPASGAPLLDTSRHPMLQPPTPRCAQPKTDHSGCAGVLRVAAGRTRHHHQQKPGRASAWNGSPSSDTDAACRARFLYSCGIGRRRLVEILAVLQKRSGRAEGIEEKPSCSHLQGSAGRMSLIWGTCVIFPGVSGPSRRFPPCPGGQSCGMMLMGSPPRRQAPLLARVPWHRSFRSRAHPCH